MSLFQRILGARLTPEDLAQRRSLSRLLGRAKGVNELFADILEATEDTGWLEALGRSMPWWAGATGEALADSIAPVRFAVKLLEGLGRIEDPDELAYLAVTLAYQRAAERALREVVGDEVTVRPERGALRRLRQATPEERYEFAALDFNNALDHPFVGDADAHLEVLARALGLGPPDQRELQIGVRRRFVNELKALLTDARSRERFLPVTERMTLGVEEEVAHRAMQDHWELQRWLFEDRPVLGREPFALSDVFVEPECGLLTWGEIDDARRRARVERKGTLVDPFQEGTGRRRPLLETVLGLLGDADFADAVVVQGVAGVGKSAFTLRLCAALRDLGLRPLRVELKDLDTREVTPTDEGLPAAVRLRDRGAPVDRDRPAFHGPDLFLGNRIFRESVRFRAATICPYVLILDGWDEVSIGAAEGYQQQLARTLNDIRRLFLEGRGVGRVRVLLAGRPTPALEASGFLERDTPILTIHPWSPVQLESYVERLESRLADERAPGGGALEEIARWRPLPSEAREQVLSRYRAAAERGDEPPVPTRPDPAPSERPSRSESSGRGGDAGADEGLRILGLPLLAHLALRLIAERGGRRSLHLLDDTTTLYRSLVDLVVDQGGKAVEGDAAAGSARPALTGDALRTLLHGTAEAMTHLGEESLSQDELALRLRRRREQLGREIESLTDEHFLSRLLVSFFFRGGYEGLGCEFSHKSFREYLFAERIVEELKTWGRRLLETEARPEKSIEDYTRDFRQGDPRREMARSLAFLLSPQWLAPEVVRHVEGLLHWEVARAADGGGESMDVARPRGATPALPTAGWRRLREASADLWDWWGEGVHLRTGAEGEAETEPLVLELARRTGPRTGEAVPLPVRLTTMDGHLGDALFRLAAWLHELTHALAGADEGVGPSRRYQAPWRHDERPGPAFAPSGPARDYFRNYAARINAAGYRPEGSFPSGVCLRRADLDGILLGGLRFAGADLSGSSLVRAYLRGADLSRTRMPFVQLRGAYLRGAYLREAQLLRADLSGAYARGANFNGANLIEADLRRAFLEGAYLGRSLLLGAQLYGAKMAGADLRQAEAFGAGYDPSDLADALLRSPGDDEATDESRLLLGFTPAAHDSTEEGAAESDEAEDAADAARDGESGAGDT